MVLSMGGDYTNSYYLVNTYPYSTSHNAQLHNQKMKFKEWLQHYLDDLKMNPTEFVRECEGIVNQPTVQRITKGKQSPGEDVIADAIAAVNFVRNKYGKPPVAFVVGPLSGPSVTAETIYESQKIARDFLSLSYQRQRIALAQMETLLSVTLAEMNAADAMPGAKKNSSSES